MLAQAGQRIENGRFAHIRIAHQGDDRSCFCFCGHTMIPPFLPAGSPAQQFPAVLPVYAADAPPVSAA